MPPSLAKVGITSLGLTLALTLALGCSSAPPPKPRTVKKPVRKTCKFFPVTLYIKAHKSINQTAQGNSLSVEIRAYLLKSRDKFDTLDFDSLWKGGDTSMGTDLVQGYSIVAFPGQEKIQQIKSPGNVAYLALMGLFRQHDGQAWKQVFDVRELSQKCLKDDPLNPPLIAHIYKNSIRLEQDMPAEALKPSEEPDGAQE